MSVEVTGPDGAVHVFPDGTDPTVIKRTMANAYSPQGLAQRRVSPTGQSIQADNRGFLGRSFDEGLAAARQSWDQDIRSINPTGNPVADTLQVGNAALGAAGSFVAPFTGPVVNRSVMGETPQINAEVARVNAQHPIFVDPQHVITNAERRDAAGQVVVGLLAPLVTKAAGAVTGSVRAALTASRAARVAQEAEALAAAGGGPRPVAAPMPAPLQPVPMAQPRSPVAVSPAPMAQASAPPTLARPYVAPPLPITPVEARVGMVLRNAASRDQMGAQAVTDLHAQDPNSLAFHGVGPNTARLAEVVAKSPGPGATIVRDAVDASRRAAPAAIRSSITSATGGDRSALALTDEMLSNRKAAANAGMQQFGGDPVTITTPPGAGLRGPHTLDAIQAAAKNALSSADPAEQAAGKALTDLHGQLSGGSGDATATMRVRDAQNVSGSLLRRADRIYKTPGGDTDTAKSLKGVGRAIRDEAAAQHPGYANWLSTYGTSADEQRAFDLGSGLFNDTAGNTPPSIVKGLQGLKGDNVQGNYTRGVGEALQEQVRKAGGDIAAVRRVLNNENIRDRLRLAFPDQASYDGFIQQFERHAANHNLNNQVMGGSPTEPLQAAKTDLQAQSGLDAADLAKGALDWARSAKHGVSGLAGKSAETLINALPKVDRSVLGDPKANALLAKALVDKPTMQRLLRAGRPTGPARP